MKELHPFIGKDGRLESANGADSCYIFLPAMSDSDLQPLFDEAGNLESMSYKDVDSKNLASSASAHRSKS